MSDGEIVPASGKKQKLTTIPDGIDLWEVSNYTPSPPAAVFHDSTAKFRFLLWGIKGGKTYAGAHDFLDMVIRRAIQVAEEGRRDKVLAWVVAPTHLQVATCERELDTLFDLLEKAGYAILDRKWARQIRYRLVDGTMIELRSGEIPDNLRGPNVDICWMDEGAFVKELAWIQVKQRISVRRGEVIVTTTPDGRNWVWRECIEAGMPAEGPYGDFGDVAGRRWVSHYPTWEFGWVPEEEIDDYRRTMPAIEFDRDIAAQFLSSGRAVFRYIEETFHEIPLRGAKPSEGAKFVIGVDLAKQQDFSVLTVMDGSGVVWDIERWSGIDYKVQKDRIRDMAEKWKAVCLVDSANIGASICDDLRDMGVSLQRVDMHSPAVKRDLIESLQAAFDSKSRAIQIPRPDTEFAPPQARVLIEELKAYEASITQGGRIRYSAPRGMHDDCVVSLALAYWGKKHGHAGRAIDAATVAIGRDEFMRGFERQVRNLPTRGKRRFARKMFGRRGVLGVSSGGPLWG